jgi:LuxR family maltose regulon positive regulatory protein
MAAEQYQAAIQAVGERGLWERWEAAIRLGDLAREQNNLDQAEDILRTALSAAEQEGVEVYLLEGYIALARTVGARGDVAASETVFDQALQIAHRLGSPDYTHHIHAYRARLALARADLPAAQHWQLKVADFAGDFGYACEVEALTLARVLIAQGRSDPGSQAPHSAQTILERLRRGAETDGRVGSLIEILALIALAESGKGRRDKALQSLQEALMLAAPASYARIFLDEGAPMRLLLAECRLQIEQQWRNRESVNSHRLLTYIDTLLAAFAELRIENEKLRKAPDHQPTAPISQFSIAQRAPDSQFETLSEREREVLHLIARGESNQAIAAALVISIGTVKSHINHILGKLAAHNRTEAVARAHELGLLEI